MDYETKTFNLMSHLHELHTDPELSEDRLATLLEDLAWYYNFYLPDFWSIITTTGVIGNVRDFRWAPRGSTALKTNAKLGSNMVPYQTHGGLVFQKYDEDDEQP